VKYGGRGNIQWRPPPKEIFKINWDAAIDTTDRQMGVDIIVIDSAGRVYTATSQFFSIVQKLVVA
jgi:hypothetical protein